ncbi:MAG: glycoside hydrolase family 9 protein [Defluviitaleaceae bacterium]|nr:glycoside hydrolase family 9 protein [Defluviitaleaceae bacterium]
MLKIHVNQLGWRPTDAKKAIISDAGATAFELVREADGAIVFRGKCGAEIFDAASEEKVRVADFSEFADEGKYFLRSELSGAAADKSIPFNIGKNPYAGLCDALLEFFNYQKCGVDLDAGLWSHPACHTSLATVYGTDKKKDVSGGWHDAGDYGRYIVPAAMTVADLLLAYELSDSPDKKIPDVVWFELEWFLKMQCKCGGVYHKVSCATFNALDEMPHDEHGDLVICPISLTATADFAATLALASRFYPAKKDVLLDAARRAWDWCMENPDAPMFTNPPGVSTGGYGDKSAADEIFWAACELFSATGEKKYADAITENSICLGLGWGDMGTYGIVAYLRAANADAALREKMKSVLRDHCEEIMQAHANEPYGTSQGVSYRWGSTMQVANSAKALLFYSRLVEKTPRYENAALEHMHYILGRNPLSQSYISGFGANAIKYPHHRPTVAVGAAFPGMVSGGANGDLTPRDLILNETCAGKPPSKCFIDHIDSFSSNEVAIYWNASVFFVASLLNM